MRSCYQERIIDASCHDAAQMEQGPGWKTKLLFDESHPELEVSLTSYF
jgi:hypothetical protein